MTDWTGVKATSWLQKKNRINAFDLKDRDAADRLWSENESNLLEIWAVFSMEKLDWVQEGTDVVCNGGRTTLTLVLQE